MLRLEIFPINLDRVVLIATEIMLRAALAGLVRVEQAASTEAAEHKAEALVAHKPVRITRTATVMPRVAEAARAALVVVVREVRVASVEARAEPASLTVAVKVARVASDLAQAEWVALLLFLR